MELILDCYLRQLSDLIQVQAQGKSGASKVCAGLPFNLVGSLHNAIQIGDKRSNEEIISTKQLPVS